MNWAKPNENTTTGTGLPFGKFRSLLKSRIEHVNRAAPQATLHYSSIAAAPAVNNTDLLKTKNTKITSTPTSYRNHY